MGYAADDGFGADATRGFPALRPTGSDLVRYADSGGLDLGDWFAEDAGLSGDAGLPGDSGYGEGERHTRARWRPDMDTGAYPIIEAREG